MSHDPLAGLLRGFNLTTMACIYADTWAQAEPHHWGYSPATRQMATFNSLRLPPGC